MNLLVKGYEAEIERMRYAAKGLVKELDSPEYIDSGYMLEKLRVIKESVELITGERAHA